MSMTKKTNLSRPIVFGYGTIVKHSVYGTGVVDHEYDADMASVLFYKDGLVNVKLSELRKISLLEYHFFQHPDGRWMIGRHSALGMGSLYAAFIAMSIYGFSMLSESIYWLALVAFSFGVIYLMLKGLRRNYNSQQM